MSSHTAVVVDQFDRQARHFARLPDHDAATALLLDLAGVGRGVSTLDVACGPGLVACAAAARGAQVTGIDVAPAMIEQARARQQTLGLAGIAWHLGDAGALPFADASFSALVTRYSLHHFPQPARVLAEMRRVAAPGARVALADLVLPEAEARAYDRMEQLRDPSHLRTLTPEALHALAAGAGLGDLRVARYAFEIDLDRLMRASFPAPGDAGRVRAMFEADLVENRMGLALARRVGTIRLRYPVMVVTGRVPA